MALIGPSTRNPGDVTIREVIDEENIARSVAVIRSAFKTVADEFGLTPVNCPTHPSFITGKGVSDLQKKGAHLFGLFIDGLMVGFVAIEQSDDGLFFIEKLAVVPEYRHASYGTRLIRHALAYIAMNNGKRVSIGIIDKHDVLKQWYRNLGFTVIGIKKYGHLPFTVCFMEKKIPA